MQRIAFLNPATTRAAYPITQFGIREQSRYSLLPLGCGAGKKAGGTVLHDLAVDPNRRGDNGNPALSLSGMFFFLFLRKAWKREFPDDYQFVTLGAVGMLLAGALLPVSTIIADRLGYYFIPAQAMIFARTPWMKSLPSRPLLAAAPYLGLLLFFIVWAMSSRHFQTCYIPYQSWILGAP